MDSLSGLWVSMLGWAVTIGVLFHARNLKKEKGNKEFWGHIMNPVFIPFYAAAGLGVAVNGIGYAIFSILCLAVLIYVVASLGGFK